LRAAETAAAAATPQDSAAAKAPVEGGGAIVTSTLPHSPAAVSVAALHARELGGDVTLAANPSKETQLMVASAPPKETLIAFKKGPEPAQAAEDGATRTTCDAPKSVRENSAGGPVGGRASETTRATSIALRFELDHEAVSSAVLGANVVGTLCHALVHDPFVSTSASDKRT
jgi:hypothetical protein